MKEFNSENKRKLNLENKCEFDSEYKSKLNLKKYL